MEKDVIIAGSGAAGLTAAVVAALGGLDVLLAEKTSFIGGASAFSGGGCWVPGSHLMAEAGFQDSKQDAVRYVQAIVGNWLKPEMLDAYLENAPRMLEFMLKETAVDYMIQPYSPDYQPEKSGARLDGRLLSPVPYDGRLLGEYFSLVRPPLAEFNAPGGMMLSLSDAPHALGMTKSFSSFLYMSRLLGGYAVQRLRYSRGTRLTMGNALVARLLRSALDAKVTIWINSPLRKLIVEDGRVAGAEVQSRGGLRRVKARRGVVLATGGFSASAEWRAKYIPFPDMHQSLMPEGNTGDGLAMAVEAGGVLEPKNANNSIGTPISLLRKPDGTTVKFPHLYLDRPKPGCIAVDRQGRRFGNEASLDFVESMQNARAVPAWLICDHAFVRKYGLGLVYPGGFGLKRMLKAGYIRQASTMRELAKVLAIDADGLERSVSQANDYARTGDDPDFRKGASAFDRSMGDPMHNPNPCLGPISRAPFYAVEIFPGDATTTIGLRVTPHAEVLDKDDRAIPGLYANGLDMNSIWSGRPPANGVNIGLGMTFGYVIGRRLAGLPLAAE